MTFLRRTNARGARLHKSRVGAHLVDASLDPSSRLIIQEAQRRGIAVDLLDERAEYFRLTLGKRSIVCRESLSELTHAVALSRCDDKRVTSALLREAGLSTPAQMEADTPLRNAAFLHEHEEVVVKPARGEQGRGVAVGVRSEEALESAIAHARSVSDPVLIEQAVAGEDLRVVLIDFRVVACAVRKRPSVVGDGERSVAELIALHSARRSAATSGASRVPIDGETRRCVRAAGYDLEDVLPAGETLVVRRAANVHTGGTIHDVTQQVCSALTEVAERAARWLDIPVLGLDLIVPSISGGEYWILEANERPGLANHEPAPTAARFVDFLFPESA